MEIKINAENPEVELQMTSEFSFILIQSISVNSLKNIDKLKLMAELKYVVEGRFIDERKEQFPIYLLTEPCQVEPVFHLNKLIKNEIFKLGINQKRNFYNKLKFYVENLDENFTLKFNIKKFRIDD